MSKKQPFAFHRIHPLFFLIPAIIFGTVCIFALRSNNQHMDTLRSAVYQADKNNDNVQQALNNLQSYVTSHMNTSLTTGTGSVYPPIQLEYTYLRLVQSEDETSLGANSGLYTAAQAYCQKLDPSDFSGHNRVPCIEQYVTSHGASAPTIPTSLYEFDFISPAWSPDLAGWSLLLSLLFLVASIFLAGLRLAFKHLRTLK